MVEFVIGRNIKISNDKVIAARTAAEIIGFLNQDEQPLAVSIKCQTADSAPDIRIFDRGSYTLCTVVLPKKMTHHKWLLCGGSVAMRIKKMREVKIALIGADENDIADFSMGIELSLYSFDKYLTKRKRTDFQALEKVIYTNSGLKNMDVYKCNAALVNAVRYARDIINEPANVWTPQVFAEDIKRLEYLGLQVDILNAAKMKERGFNLVSAVGQGSANEPRVAVIRWKGNSDNKGFDVGLVGKGVTFDSGGLSLKSTSGMQDMKGDMAGAAVAVATMKSLALQKCPKNAVAVVGLAENMPSGSAVHCGDIITSMDGMTVEIIDTDCEGRLVLADCLTYIQEEYSPKYIVDIATLTGAISVALGDAYAGLFCDDAKLGKQLLDAGEYCGEELWRMPMMSFNNKIESNIADIKNDGGRRGGSSIAACFLRRFIKKDMQWAHIDIAGVDNSEGSLLYPKGASGFGVLLLNRFITELSDDV